MGAAGDAFRCPSASPTDSQPANYAGRLHPAAYIAGEDYHEAPLPKSCPMNQGIPCPTPESEDYRLAERAMGQEMLARLEGGEFQNAGCRLRWLRRCLPNCFQLFV
jgi:hypothetical protein